MDRYPIDNSSGEEPPASPERPAAERSLVTGTPFPPTVSTTDRPAGPYSTAPVPPPPPPPGSRVEEPGVAPPTAPWMTPPMSSGTPRPASVIPPPPPSAVGGPPVTPTVPTDRAPAPPAPSRGRWRAVVGFAAGLAVSALLVGGGVVIGTQIGDDDPVMEQADPVTTSPVGNETGSDLTPTTAPPPVIDDDPGVEPVTAVARALSPSVVLINTGVGQGSGIIWDAENGYIVTNDHVVGNANTVSVLFDDGVQVSGVVVGGDAARDIAVVQVDPEGLDLVEAVFAATETVEVGQLAVAIGSPFGLDQTVTAGIVSAVNRINQFGGSDPSNPVAVEMIQTDAPINPGNSGGALANKDGHVIGMNTSIRTDGVTTANVGVGFAVPSDTILIIAQRIVNGESLELGFLGINGATPTDGTLGALVSLVVEASPADVAGLEVGDLIIEVDGEVVSTMEQLAADFKFFRPGDEIEIDILREGRRITLQVTVGSN